MRSASISLFLVCALLLVAGAAPARPPAYTNVMSGTLTNILAAEEAGVITPDEAALNRVYHVFDRERVDRRFAVENERPGKSA